MEAIKFASDRVIKQVMGLSVQENSRPFDTSGRRYAMPARNREEALAQIAAEEGAATPQNSQQLADPAAQIIKGRPMNWREQLARRQKMAEQPKEVHREPQKQAEGDNGINWLL